MPKTEGSNFQDVNEAGLAVLGQTERSNNEVLMSAVDNEFEGPFRLAATFPTPDSKLNITGSQVASSDGTGKNAAPLNNQVIEFDDSTIDFQAQSTTGGTIDITWEASTVGQYRRLGLSLLASGVIRAIFSDEEAVFTNLPNPGDVFVRIDAVPIGWLDLVCTDVTGKFKTVGSATNIIENSVGSDIRVNKFSNGAGAGGAGEEAVSFEPADGFQLAVQDKFDASPGDASARVDSSVTNADYEPEAYYRLSCDKSRTVSPVGTSYTLSGAPGFTVKEGDIVYVNSTEEWRRIDTVTTQTTGVLDTAFSGNPTAEAGMVSQAVWTKDLISVGEASQKTRPGVPVPLVSLDYVDSLDAGDTVGDINDDARIVASASNDGVQADVGLPDSDTFLPFHTRPSGLDLIQNYDLGGAGERLFIVFFCNPDNATVTAAANVLDYRVSLYELSYLLNGGILESAFCMSDGTGTANNCQPPTVVFDATEGKNVTEVELDFSFVSGVKPGQPSGHIISIVEGNILPRKFPGVVGQFWFPAPGSNNKVRFSDDLSGQSFSLHFEKRQGTIDVSDLNRALIETNIDDIAANTLALPPIGSITAFSGGYFTNSSNGGFTMVQAGGNNAAAVNAALPANWRVCDGAALNDPESPIFNGGSRYLPNLDDNRFIMGSTSVGATGGANSYDLTHTHSISVSVAAANPGHTHSFSGYAKLHARYVSSSPSHLAQQKAVAAWPSNVNLIGSWVVGGDPVNEYVGTDVIGSVSGNSMSHGHSASSSLGTGLGATTVIPQYLTCFYIMRVK